MFLGLYIVALFVITFICFLLPETILSPETVLYNESLSEVISNNNGSKIVNHSFNYINNIPKDTPSFIMKYMSSPSHYSPILDSALKGSLNWSKAASITETSMDLTRPTTSGTDISRNDSVMGTVYNVMKNVSSSTFYPSNTFSPFTPSTYAELNKEISNIASNMQFIEETCKTPERKFSLLEKVVDHYTYLLNQKYSHLDAVQKMAADTPITQTDYDNLVENYSSLNTILKIYLKN